jgi:hypothetical protein
MMDLAHPLLVSSRGRRRACQRRPRSGARLGGAAAFVQSGPPVVVDPGITLSDADSLLAGRDCSHRRQLLPGEDLLSFAARTGISGAWDPTTGTLTLSGAALIADYRALLRSIAFSSFSGAPSTLLRSIEFVIDDGSSISVGVARDVSVQATSPAPHAPPPPPPPPPPPEPPADPDPAPPGPGLGPNRPRRPPWWSRLHPLRRRPSPVRSRCFRTTEPSPLSRTHRTISGQSCRCPPRSPRAPPQVRPLPNPLHRPKTPLRCPRTAQCPRRKQNSPRPMIRPTASGRCGRRQSRAKNRPRLRRRLRPQLQGRSDRTSRRSGP